MRMDAFRILAVAVNHAVNALVNFKSIRVHRCSWNKRWILWTPVPSISHRAHFRRAWSPKQQWFISSRSAKIRLCTPVWQWSVQKLVDSIYVAPLECVYVVMSVRLQIFHFFSRVYLRVQLFKGRASPSMTKACCEMVRAFDEEIVSQHCPSEKPVAKKARVISSKSVQV